jgi:ubiquinone/menaquinone biosynthesis C-methylase UbiE
MDLEIQQILDLGCGPGYLWIQNSKRIPEHWELTLADISLGMLIEGKGQIPPVSNALKYTVSNAQSLPFALSSFDLVIANHMLYHVPDLNLALSEIRRVLRPNGRLFCTTNSNRHMQELFTLLQSVGLETSKWNENGDTDLPFSLENGFQLLKNWFSRVEARVYEDALKVTEIEPLLNYILSMSGIREALERDPERLKRLRSKIQHELDAKGSFHISKSPGLFISI